MADDAPTLEDEREIELSTISDIFPELLIDSNDPFSATLDLPVNPTSEVSVVFPEAADGVSIATARLADDQQLNDAPEEVHLLSHLPSLRLTITLPKGYPDDVPPQFQLSTVPPWMSAAKLGSLEADGTRLWEEYGRSQVVFAYIDHLQQAAENAFDILEGRDELCLTQELKIAVLDFDIEAKKAAFNKETFDCGICLEPKKGTACHRMLDCGHVFCRACLQDFYNNAITEGDLASIRCLAPNCAKKRGEEVTKQGKRKTKTQVSPSELLEIPLERDVVQRYVTLKHKAELESDKNTIYCPRKWCQGAARSKKHRKPADLLDVADSSDEEDEPINTKGYLSRDELLAVCEDCSFAFCRRCFRGWHGESVLCIPRTNTGELTEEDKASLEYLKLHTTPCPTCAAPAQKTHGCNHMICFRCNSHFCYLCSAWLEPGNPYKHFNMDTTPCYMRLWELEGGDGDDVGQGFGGDGAAHAQAIMEDGFGLNDDDGLEIEDDDDTDDPDELDFQRVLGDDAQNVGRLNGDRHVNMNAAPPARRDVEREAPLVLRLAAPAPPPAPVIVPEPARGGRQNRGGRGGGRGRGHVHNVGYAARRDAAIARRMRERPAAGARRGEELNEADQAWVQRFVVAALNDEEDDLLIGE